MRVPEGPKPICDTGEVGREIQEEGPRAVSNSLRHTTLAIQNQESPDVALSCHTSNDRCARKNVKYNDNTKPMF